MRRGASDSRWKSIAAFAARERTSNGIQPGQPPQRAMNIAIFAVIAVVWEVTALREKKEAAAAKAAAAKRRWGHLELPGLLVQYSQLRQKHTSFDIAPRASLSSALFPPNYPRAPARP